MAPMNLIFQSLGPLNEPVKPILTANLLNNIQRPLSIPLTCNLSSHNTHVPSTWDAQHFSLHCPTHLSRNLTNPLTVHSVLSLPQPLVLRRSLRWLDKSSSDFCA